MNNSKMTANNKIDLLVSPDGTVKPLLVNMTQRVRRLFAFRRFLYVLEFVNKSQFQNLRI